MRPHYFPQSAAGHLNDAEAELEELHQRCSVLQADVDRVQRCFLVGVW